MNLGQSAKVLRVPGQVLIDPAEPHPSVDGHHGAELVEVEVDDGHAEVDLDCVPVVEDGVGVLVVALEDVSAETVAVRFDHFAS